MAELVKGKRTYNSPRREEQAAVTRREILSAAKRLFEQDGYASTTMAAIAAEARVALKTVYVAFDTKSGVLRALWNLTLRGGDGELSVAQQDWYREVLEEADPERQLRLNARNSSQGKVRLAPVLDVIRSAAPVDPEIGALWTRIQSEYRANQEAICQSLQEKDALKPALEVERATDILWAINNPIVWQLLVADRGWTPAEYEEWSGDLARDQLLRGH